ncbi:restriction endonuclease subunit S [Parabacteroides merdae]|uniref:Restriction endonuclease subunit S n=2 Tax=Bacteroidia TaxID=200643 RepID=A0A9Q4NUC5_BACFG|nr:MULTISPECIES: restriction endonuclease subunit S [Bacteroidaceae]MDB8961808.1 restriction endonuclease subunit S [Parabacteroides merdae]MCM1785010.1 restriction endonuclease subunit S [Phocaeicola vulgatus]MCZ2569896.1 restriction endonuclease subunit S [Bacteroides fragilis]MDB8965830.1 restriction endonuclease subunit S [Parabacteroides merdae]MDB8970398.1 restriction endonuclease subunit S [Parabacteroides merdae]
MNGKQLKNSILQWAIQGKLVPQDPNDEPASVLLERIRAEKARLVKEKKIKKDKNESIIYRGDDNSYYEKFLPTGEVKCIDEEIPFEIPNGWQWERIGNIFETTSGSTPLSRNPDYYKNGNINWVRTTDLNNGILNKTEIQITSKAIIDYNLSILPQTSVCVAMYGGAGTIGKHCILHFDTTINQSVCAIQPNGFCNMDYIHTFIEYQRPFWMDFAAGSRKDPNINQLIIKHCLLPIPPQEEQLRIVTKLNQLYPYIYQYGNSQNRLNQINKEIWHSLKKSILQEAIQGKLVPQIAEEGTAQELLEQIRQEKLQLVKEGKLKKSALTDSIIFRGDDNKYYEQVGNENIDITEEIPFDLPENWTWVRFGQYVRMSIGKTPPRGETKYWANGKYPWVSISDMSDYGLVTTTKESVSEYAKSLFGEISPVGTLIMSFKLTVGRSSLLNTSAYHNEAIISIYPFVDKNYQARNFLFHILPIISNLGDTKDAIKGKTLNSKSLNNLLLPLPPLNEQGRIVAMIELLFDKLK